jgi:hypothetical protein
VQKYPDSDVGVLNNNISRRFLLMSPSKNGKKLSPSNEDFSRFGVI